ncbi:type II and III secretion system protein family protein [Altererythrobacter arenosus]|uniref:Type II and III secretion system protein family protein n=1 Tax=Altererythrobacter arenosus TaxID=3032592 RepID=A0ABY8FXC2_9SPHN|nr:type II and III secretion system protein family protein [Altererythrobacter sp. CAU 1644]WFL78046.1 type II and III secretion system protein family protein [Altererythrobacter sp. CAU 1644]
MKRRLLKTALIAACAVAPLASMPVETAVAQSVRNPSSEIVISIGSGELVTVPGAMADVFIANDSIADVQIKSQRQLYVFGKSGGLTTIYASNAAGDIIWSANVRVGSNLDSIDQMLALAMPEAKIGVATMGSNTVLLTGTVAAPEDAAEAERLVQAFVGDNTNVISRLKMATPLQVNLQVRFAEVSRSLVREINGNLTTSDFGQGFRFGIGNGRALGTGSFDPAGPVAVGRGVQNPSITFPDGSRLTGPGIGTTGTGSTIAGLGRLFGLDVISAFDLAERIGLISTLSQPNLTALSGETAEFLAGGEFPIPISQGLGTTSIDYRKFGVSLSYTPTVLANGRISLRVRPEVSELSSQGAVTVNGFQIPALTIRRAETSIELGSGQSFMIAGLMSNNAQNSIDKTPGLGDVPILGNLFRSRSFRKGETELVIVVTPYLVEPVNAADIKLPTDGYQASDELQQLLGFQYHDGVSGGSRPTPRAVNEDAPPPAVSEVDPAAIVPTSQSSTERQAEGKKRKKERRADSAAPGFSL